MARHSFDVLFVFFALALQETAVLPQVAKEFLLFHETITVSWIASSGTPRRPSSRRSSRIKAIASPSSCDTPRLWILSIRAGNQGRSRRTRGRPSR